MSTGYCRGLCGSHLIESSHFYNDFSAQVESEIEMSMPPQSWSPGKCWKHRTVTWCYSAIARLNSKRLPGTRSLWRIKVGDELVLAIANFTTVIGRCETAGVAIWF